MFGSGTDESQGKGGAVVEASADTISPSVVRLLDCQFYNNSALRATLLADNSGRSVEDLASGACTHAYCSVTRSAWLSLHVSAESCRGYGLWLVSLKFAAVHVTVLMAALLLGRI